MAAKKSVSGKAPAAKKATAQSKMVAGLVDELYKTRERRYALQRQATALEDQEKEIRKQLVVALPRFGATGVAGRVARAQLEGKVIKKIEDWSKFCAFMAKKKAWDLVQRRVNDAAVQARWDAKETVAGVVPETVTFVSLHKL